MEKEQIQNTEASQNANAYMTEENPTEAQEDTTEESAYQGTMTIPEDVFKCLPHLLQKTTAVFENQREKDLVLTSALSVLGGCFHTVNGIYHEDRVFPNLFSFIIAPAASGKSRMKYARQLAEKVDEAYGKRLIELSDQSGKKRKISPSFYIAGNTTSAAIINALHINDGVGLLCETEADTLTNSIKSDYGSFSDLLRKGLHAESYSYSRKGDLFLRNSVAATIREPKFAVSISGTPGQLVTLIPSAEDGLFSRFIYYIYEKPIAYKPVVMKNSGSSLSEYFSALSTEVLKIYEKINALKIHFTITENQLARLNELLERYHAKLTSFISNETQSVVFRMGLIGFKISMVLSVLRHCENNTLEDKIECQDIDFKTMLSLIEVYLHHSVFAYERVPQKSDNSLQEQAITFYSLLPDQFERKDILKEISRYGISVRTMDNYLKKFQASGTIERIKHGEFRKIY